MANTERNCVIPVSFLMLKRDDEVLLLRRFNSGFQDGMYTMISGHVEKGESPLTAVCREATEEAGIEINPDNVKFEQVLYRRGFNNVGDGYDTDQPERVDFFFSADEWSGEPVNAEPDKCDDLAWFPMNGLPSNVFPIVRKFLNQYVSNSSYRDSGY